MVTGKEARGGGSGMEKAREALTIGEEASARVSSLDVRPHRSGRGASFFEGFTLRGIRVDRVHPGLLTCSFTIPPRLTDSDGKLTAGAIASLVDEVGWAATLAEGLPWKVSVDMSVSFMSPAAVGDELEITSRVLGHKGGYSGTHVLLKNKATGKMVAEGRHALFARPQSKI